MADMHLQLLWSTDPNDEGEGGGIRIPHFPFVLGRHPECDYRLTDPLVSRRHCSFFLREGAVWVVDLGSRNGTSLNGQPVKRAQPVHDGDWLALGPLPFQIRLSGTPAALPANAEPVVPAARSGGQGQTVLVVEDDVDTAETLAALLENWGHKVHVAHDGPEAIEAAQAHLPDTVLLDLRLPRMDGYQVAQRLRAEPGLEKALVVAITGCAPEPGSRRSEEAGIDRVLTKPVDLGTLQEVVGPSR